MHLHRMRTASRWTTSSECRLVSLLVVFRNHHPADLYERAESERGFKTKIPKNTRLRNEMDQERRSIGRTDGHTGHAGIGYASSHSLFVRFAPPRHGSFCNIVAKYPIRSFQMMNFLLAHLYYFVKERLHSVQVILANYWF